MGIAQIFITHDESTADMTNLIQVSNSGNRQLEVQKLVNYLMALQSGVRKATVEVQVGGVQASGTLTFASVIATDAFAINGVTFTAVASGATGNQFNVGGDDTATAAAAAAAINASATAGISGVVTATSALGVITVTAVEPGVEGNAITLTSADATITVSGARLENGTEGTSVTYRFGT